MYELDNSPEMNGNGITGETDNPDLWEYLEGLDGPTDSDLMDIEGTLGIL